MKTNYFQHILLITQFILFLTFNVMGNDNYWSTNGPYGARVTKIAFYPNNSQKLYIGTVENGIYRSIDGGENWEWLESDNLPTNIREIKFHPVDPDTIYVTTTYGLYKSFNSGASWQNIIMPNGYNDEIYGFEIHPLQPNILFCNGMHLNYKSIDGGRSWIELDLPWLYVMKFVVDPENDSLVYLISQSARFRKSIYKSENLGTTWECIHNNLDTNLVAIDLAVDPVETNVLYIAGGDAYEQDVACLERSDDGGENWIDITPDCLSIKFIETVVVSPIDHNNIFVGTAAEGLLKSQDRGLTWESMNSGISGDHAYRLAIDSLTGTFYLSILFDGLYKSIDYGGSWQKKNDGISHLECNGLIIDYSNTNRLFVATYKDLYKSEDYGASWNIINIEWPLHSRFLSTNILIDPFDNNYIYGGFSPSYDTGRGGIYRSTDSGNSWQIFSEGLAVNILFFNMSLSVYPNEFRRLFLCSGEGLYFSDNLGENWDICNGGLPVDIAFRSIDVCSVNPELVYAGDNTGRLFRSIDGGDNWELIPVPAEGSYCNEIKCGAEENVVYICKYQSGAYKSEDSGMTWQNISNNLPLYPGYIYLSGIAINPLNPDNIFINSHHYGIFQSHDGGASWDPFNEGLNINYSSAITIIDPLDTCRVYLATNQSSAWSITRTGTSINYDEIALPAEFSACNYPNPFNASTNISFSLPQASAVRLDIYDMLGRKVSSLMNEYMFAGYHTVVWHPDDLGSGMYFYRITAGDYDACDKVMLLK